LERGLFNYGTRFPTKMQNALRDAEGVGERLRALRWRLGVGLTGEHAAVVVFVEAHDALWAAIRAATAHPAIPKRQQETLPPPCRTVIID
jgi:hypothetical protein